MQQSFNFNGPVAKVVTNNIQRYDDSPKNESKTIGVTVKLTETQREVLKTICFDNGIDVSAFINQAISSYIKIFPYRDKLSRHTDLLSFLLQRLS